MKIDFINALVALAVSALLAWGAYSMTSVESLKTLVAIVSFVALAASSMCAIAIKTGEQRSSVVNRATSGAFFIFLIILNGAFTFFDFSRPLYVILNALTLLVMLLVNRSVARSGM